MSSRCASKRATSCRWSASCCSARSRPTYVRMNCSAERFLASAVSSRLISTSIDAARTAASVRPKSKSSWRARTPTAKDCCSATGNDRESTTVWGC